MTRIKKQDADNTDSSKHGLKRIRKRMNKIRENLRLEICVIRVL